MGDGFHRHAGAKRAGLETIPALVREGTQRDALLYSAGANATHGLRRTAEDKRQAVRMLLGDEEWRRASNRWVAERCKVSDHTVASVRAEAEAPGHAGNNGQSGGASASGAQTRTSDNGGSATSEKRSGRDNKSYPATGHSGGTRPRRDRRKYYYRRLDRDTKEILGDHPATSFIWVMKKLWHMSSPQRQEAARRLADSDATTAKEALKVLTAPAQREPGDDTELEEAAKAKDRADRKANGKPPFDDSLIVEALKKLHELLNGRATALGQQKSPAWAAVREKENALLDAWDAWSKEGAK
jgi:hypothetical protein